MIRVFALAAGVACACVTSQAPEFIQQYQQRLAGQVDALRAVVLDFDTSALEAGLGREEALGQMVGTPFLEARQRDMRATFARHAVLADHLMALRAATPFEQLTMPHRVMDSQTVQATWGDYKPAVPLTAAGLVAGGGGAVFGWGSALIALSGVAGLFRRSRKATSPRPERREPVVASPDWSDRSVPRARLSGAVR